MSAATPREEKIQLWSDRTLEQTTAVSAMRATRLGKLLELGAPNNIVEIELRMLLESLEARRRKLGYTSADLLLVGMDDDHKSH